MLCFIVKNIGCQSCTGKFSHELKIKLNVINLKKNEFKEIYLLSTHHISVFLFSQCVNSFFFVCVFSHGVLHCTVIGTDMISVIPDAGRHLFKTTRGCCYLLNTYTTFSATLQNIS